MWTDEELDSLDAEIRICMNWPKADVPDDFRRPLRSDLSFLLMNGDRDAATPARWSIPRS